MKHWFNEPGAYVLVDGQFGSTGKGLLAGYIAKNSRGLITHVTTNAGPNSGHTAYFENEETGLRDKIMTQQIPVASVFLERMGQAVPTLINAGAVIDSDILAAEVGTHLQHRNVLIHPNAALISEYDRREDQHTVRRIAGTGKGIGPAQAQKVNRRVGATAAHMYAPMLPAGQDDRTWDRFWNWYKDVVFVETAQGYSLGLNSSRFYPNVTSRECTVMQAIADARIPVQMVKGVVACFRTFPIRVGSTEGSSGGCYEDQLEMTWDEVGVPAEMTTVTKRVRRVFSWSRIQFQESIAANRPDTLFINFMNYIKEYDDQCKFLRTVLNDYQLVMGRDPEEVLLGWGPYTENICTMSEFCDG